MAWHVRILVGVKHGHHEGNPPSLPDTHNSEQRIPLTQPKFEPTPVSLRNRLSGVRVADDATGLPELRLREDIIRQL